MLTFINDCDGQGTPCRVTISGTPMAIQSGVDLVVDVMNNGPQRLSQMGPPHGGMPFGGGGGSGGGGGGGGGFPPQQPYNYGPPASPYGYGGGPPPVQYGGGPPYGAPAYQQPVVQPYQPPVQPPIQPPPPPSKPLGPEWQECKTPDGTPYWYNSITQVSQVG